MKWIGLHFKILVNHLPTAAQFPPESKQIPSKCEEAKVTVTYN
jgi:hypothetical protein